MVNLVSWQFNYRLIKQFIMVSHCILKVINYKCCDKLFYLNFPDAVDKVIKVFFLLLYLIPFFVFIFCILEIVVHLEVLFKHFQSLLNHLGANLKRSLELNQFIITLCKQKRTGLNFKVDKLK